MRHIQRYLLLVILSGILCNVTSAQTRSVVDSLTQLLRNAQPDSVKIKLYSNLSWEYFRINQAGAADIARQYADSIMMLAQKSGSERDKTFAHFYYGLVERKKQNYQDAIGHFQQFIAYRASIGDSMAVAKGLFQLGVVQNQLGRNTMSLATYYRALAIYKEMNFTSGYVQLLNTIGVVLKNIKNYDEAAETFNQALNILDTLDEMKSEKANVLGNMANVFAERKEFDKARFFMQKALILDIELDDMWAVAMDYENIGNVFLDIDQYDSALYYQLKALAIRRDILPGKRDLATSLNKVGFAYFKTGNTEMAKDHLSRALSLAEEINARPLLRDVYSTLSQLYASKQDYKKAYEFDQLFKSYHDSLLNENIARQLNELHTLYESEKKDRQITQLATEKELQKSELRREKIMKRASIIGLILLTLLGIAISYTYHQKLRNQKLLAAKDNEINEAIFKRQVSDLEMKALRAQINPHFLFNCMNSINRMILEGENENASQYLAKFSKLVRLILENAEKPKVSLQNELSLLESYIQLETLRFKDKINYRITVDAAIDPDAMYLPSMVLQPFVENAIWHGLMHKPDGEQGVLEISVMEKDGRLFCSIEDNGVGRAKARELANKSVLKTKSMGMRITEERLRLLSKQSLEKLVNIVDLKDSFNNALGTRVEINFPAS